MFHEKVSVQPGRKGPFSRWTLGFVVFLGLLVLGVFFYSLHMAASNRILVFELDPYISIRIEGADGYGIVSPELDTAKLEADFRDYLLASGRNLDEKTLDQLAEMVTSSVSYDVEVQHPEEEGGEEASDESDEPPQAAQESEAAEDGILPQPGVANGDTVTLRASVTNELQDRLMEEGLAIAFDFDPLTQTVSGLPDAEPYDLFKDLTVTFAGYDGNGEASIVYNGYYPFTFSADLQTGLHNGQVLTVSAALTEGYDLDRLVEEYSIMPTALQQTYTVTGLWVDPASIQDLNEETVSRLLQQSREQISGLLEAEYEENERLDALDEEGMYFCTLKNSDTPDENENVDNRLYCIYLVHYINTGGDELAYYYYVRYDNLVLDDSGAVLQDLTVADHPQKPSIPLGELFGDGSEVSVPGILNFRTLAGYETKDQILEQVITPLEETYEITSLEF